MTNIIKYSLASLFFLLLSCGSKDTPSQPTNPQSPPNKPTTSEPSPDSPSLTGGLIGSTWKGDGTSENEPFLHSYIFQFSSDRLKIEVSCHMDSGDINLTAETPVVYTENGNIATMKTGIQSRTPLGNQTCSIVFPANLQFHLEGATISFLYNGARKKTKLAKVN